MTDIGIPSRTPSDTSADDTILPFEVSALDLRGRVVRLGPMVDEILTRPPGDMGDEEKAE